MGIGSILYSKIVSLYSRWANYVATNQRNALSGDSYADIPMSQDARRAVGIGDDLPVKQTAVRVVEFRGEWGKDLPIVEPVGLIRKPLNLDGTLRPEDRERMRRAGEYPVGSSDALVNLGDALDRKL